MIVLEAATDEIKLVPRQGSGTVMSKPYETAYESAPERDVAISAVYVPLSVTVDEEILNNTSVLDDYLSIEMNEGK